MSKKRKKNFRNANPISRPGAAGSRPNEEDVPDLATLEKEAIEHAVPADFGDAEAEPGPPPDAVPSKIIADAWEVLKLLRAQRQRAERELRSITSETERLAQARSELDAATSAIEARSALLHDRESQVDQRESAIRAREADADAGFAERGRTALADIAQQREALKREIGVERETLQAELHRREEALAEREGEIVKRERDLRKSQTKLDLEREILKEDQGAFAERVERYAAAKVEEHVGRLRYLEAALQRAREERDELANRLAEREHAVHELGGLTVEGAARDLGRLRAECERLRGELANRPDESVFRELEQATGDLRAVREKNQELLRECSALTTQLHNNMLSVTQVETLRNQKAALEASNGLLTRALEEHVRKANELLRGSDGSAAFPSCRSLDDDPAVQRKQAFTRVPQFTLKDFADDVRNRIASGVSGQPLYYSPADVRSFIAGLATSRLHLLQGISGTGKTSLPLAFAHAIDAGHRVIEVQAGWRDRQDLIGHFNAFEKKYYESEFLQALYKAGCPAHRDAPFFIVLDEMNLSHPEQYFADLLSALEQPEQQQELVLMTAAVDPAPKLFVDGRRLPIPSNVWFVGTANHDETTKDFADKTYDRAHVMELPRHHEVFEPPVMQAPKPIGLAQLESKFADARDQHREQADRAYRLLEQELADELGERFGIGWGNRLQRQMQSYVPVVIACGGSIGEATDHVIATKLLHKVRDRHANREEDLQNLRDRLRSAWDTFDDTHPPNRSLAVIDDELRRMRAYGG